VEADSLAAARIDESRARDARRISEASLNMLLAELGVEAVAGGAGVDDAAGVAVAGGAKLLGRENDVGGVLALGGGVAFGAVEVGVFEVVESAVVEPAFGHGGPGDFGAAGGVGFDFVAIGATGIEGGGGAVDGADAGLGTEGGVAEEDAFFEFVARADALLQTADFFLGEFVLFVARGQSGLGGEGGVLAGEPAQKRGDELGIAVGHGEAGGFGIELEGMAGLAMVGELDAAHVGAAGVGLVAGCAGEFLSGGKGGNRRAGKVEGVIEFEGIGVAPMVGLDAEFGMVGFEIAGDRADGDDRRGGQTCFAKLRGRDGF